MKFNSDGQTTKTESDYKDKSSDPAIHCCGLCTQIIKCHETGKHFCRVVEGEVDYLGGCKLFDLNLIKWANWPIVPGDKK